MITKCVPTFFMNHSVDPTKPSSGILHTFEFSVVVSLDSSRIQLTQTKRLDETRVVDVNNALAVFHLVALCTSTFVSLLLTCFDQTHETVFLRFYGRHA